MRIIIEGEKVTIEEEIVIPPKKEDIKPIVLGTLDLPEELKKILREKNRKETTRRHVLRERETDTFKLMVGDRISVRFVGPDFGGDCESHTATAIEERDGKMLFLLDKCLDKRLPMNENNTTEGGWENCFMRRKLKQYAEQINILGDLAPFENGDLLTLLTTEEVTGEDVHWNDVPRQIKWMKDRRHRIAGTRNDPDGTNWWLRSVVSATYFAYVDNGGCAGYGDAGIALGVRPAFQIKI